MVGLSLSAIAAAPLDSAGGIDLVVAGDNTESAHVLSNRGAGLFEAPLAHPVSSRPVSLVVADFDGGGGLDLALVSHSDNALSVLLHDGQSDAFVASEAYSTGTNPVGIATGDLDGDGRPDLAITNYGGGIEQGGLSIFLNHGDGTFAPRADYEVGWGPWGVAIADLDGDGLKDVVTVGIYETGTLAFLFNQGGGQFAPAILRDLHGSFTAIVAGDVDGDHDVDLAISGQSGFNVYIFENDGHGIFTNVAAPLVSFARALALSDVDADGDADILAASYHSIDKGEVTVLRNDGPGDFKRLAAYPASFNPNSLAPADLNADGKVDIAVANGDGAVTLLFGRGDGTFIPSERYLGANTFALTDVDADGTPDVLTPTEPSDLMTLSNDGHGHFFDRQQQAVGRDATTILSEDLDADGQGDVVLVAGAELRVLFGEQDGSLGDAADYVLGDLVDAVVSADANADGHLDLVILEQGGRVAILTNLGGGAFSPAIHSPTRAESTGLAACDLDGDSRADVIVAGRHDYTLHVLPNVNDEGLGEPEPYHAGRGPERLVCADFDGDGARDLFVSNGDDYTLSLLVNDGQGGFGEPKSYALRYGANALEAVDIDGDGDLDLAVAENYWGTAVLVNGGTGEFETQYFTHQNGAFIATQVAARDVDADGRPDIVMAGREELLVRFGHCPAR